MIQTYSITKKPGTIPAWLAPDDIIYDDTAMNIFSLHCTAFRDAKTFHIQAGHWAVRPLQAGLTPWAGGDTAPSDYDGGRVMCRNGDLKYIAYGMTRWDHNYGNMDIIGYPKRAIAPVAPLSLADQLNRVMHPDERPFSATAAHERGARFIMERERAAYDHAVRLLNALTVKHGADQPAIAISPTIQGVIDQIDNLTTLWKAPDPDSVTVARMTEAETTKWLQETFNAHHTSSFNRSVLSVYRHLNLIKPDPTPTMLEQFAAETGVTITDDNRAAIERALGWHRDV